MNQARALGGRAGEPLYWRVARENGLKNFLPAVTVVLILQLFSGPAGRANDQRLPEAPALAAGARPDLPQQPGARPGADAGPQHRFWDGRNVALFSLVGFSRALDYSSTLNMRRRGRQELLLTNEVVDNHLAFAAIEVGGTAVSIGASYLFHRYGHHRLERWTSIIHASLATSGAVRNYCLKTAPPSTTS